MNELDELYQELIIDHSRHPRNFHRIEGCGHANCVTAEGANPLCGDKLTIYLEISDDRITDLSFEGSGCAIFTASASLMTEALQGLSVEAAHTKLKGFLRLLTGEAEAGTSQKMGKLIALAGVREFPMRVKCATLAWRTVEAAFNGGRTTASTEL